MTYKDLQKIIALLQSRDERGEKLFWYKLILPYKKECIRYLTRTFKNWELLESPEDIADDVFLKLREKLIQGRELNLLPNIQGYLNVMCRNEYYNRIPKLKSGSIGNRDFPDELEDSSEIEQEKKAAYKKAFDNLTLEKQQLIIWHRIELKSVEWIAKKLVINKEGVRKRIYRAFKELQKLAKDFLRIKV